jgi:hypothetical protein
MSDYNSNSNHEGEEAFGQRAAAPAAPGSRQFDFSAEPEIVQHPSDSETYDRQPLRSHYNADDEGHVSMLLHLMSYSEKRTRIVNLCHPTFGNYQLTSFDVSLAAAMCVC